MGNYIYVVEMKCGKKWDPTVGVALTREKSRKEKNEWETNNPCGVFRIVKYLPEKVRA